MRVPVRILGCITLTSLLYWHWNVLSEVVVKTSKLQMFQQPYEGPDKNQKTILLWNKLYSNWPSWQIAELGYSWEGHRHSDLRDFGCDEESYNCVITSNRSYLEDESLYDGVLFHQLDINQMDLPDQRKRRGNQVYVFHCMESPTTSLTVHPDGFYYVPPMNNKFFNVTMTYHSQSGIHTPYGRIVKTEDHPTGDELDRYIVSYGQQNARILNDRNFSAAIFVSNCVSTSRREDVVSEMGKLMPVDTHGKCGQWGEDSHLSFKGAPFIEVYKEMSQTYPFHLAFENSLCDDYVTDRFFITLSTDMIPVVLNWANMSRIAPRHSYIDVKDFATITELVNYLQKVYADPALYASYFWWRQFYEVEDTTIFTKSYSKIFCEACRYLHNGKGPRVVDDLKRKWVEGRCMEPPIIS